VVSTFQESCVNIEPAGMGVTIALGQILDPLNDMTERVSDIMVISLISIGIMKIMIEIGPFISVYCVLSISMIFFLLSLVFCRRTFFNLGKVLLFIAIFIRFSVPGIACFNDVLYQQFLSDEHNKSTTSIDRDMKNLEDVQNSFLESELTESQGNEEDKSAWESFKSVCKKGCDFITDSKTHISRAINNIKNFSKNLIDSFIQLCIIYILNTIVFPIGLLWLGVCILKNILKVDLLSALENKIKHQLYPLKITGHQNNHSDGHK
jgi:hypothetical protein